MRSVAVCAVIAGDSPIRIKWLKDGVQLSVANSVDYKIEMLNEFTSSITFMALKRKHAGRYTCIASNMASSDQHSADLKVNGNFILCFILLVISLSFSLSLCLSLCLLSR